MRYVLTGLLVAAAFLLVPTLAYCALVLTEPLWAPIVRFLAQPDHLLALIGVGLVVVWVIGEA